jgi:CheY-like chemotaxis protein
VSADVLFVDDDRAILDGIRRSLHGRLPGVTLHFAVGGTDACTRLRTQPVDAVVTDLRMPEVDGTAVLLTALAVQPSAARMVLSGWVDEGETLRSLQVAHRLIRKPTPLVALVGAIAGLTGSDASSPCATVCSKLGRLVTLPRRLGAVASFCRQVAAHASADVVSSVVGRDLALTLTLLRIAGCAAEGVDEPPMSVPGALERLGMDTVRNAVTQTTLFELRWPSTGWGATVAEVLADFSNARGGAGIHPGATGLLALAACAPDEMRQALAFTGGDGEAVAAAERLLIGATHQEVGARLLRLWGIAGSGALAPDRDLQDAVAELAALACATVRGKPSVPVAVPAVPPTPLHGRP